MNKQKFLNLLSIPYLLFSNNIHEKITRFWLAKNECILV